MFETVEYSIEQGVARVVFNRPKALNALSLQLTKDTRAAIEKAISDNARAIILSGNGRAFCSGGDLREMHSMSEKEGRIEAFLEEPLAELHRVISLICETPIPFIAAVNGICAGAGTNFALACDLVIADEEATFNEAFIKIGLSPDCGGSYFLPRAIGTKVAAELMMTGDTLSAKRACEIGLINRVSNNLQIDSFELGLRLANLPTAVIGRIKKMLNESFTNSLEEQLKLEHKMQLESGKGIDFKEGVSAFFEKRAPKFNQE